MKSPREESCDYETQRREQCGSNVYRMKPATFCFGQWLDRIGQSAKQKLAKPILPPISVCGQ